MSSDVGHCDARNDWGQACVLPAGHTGSHSAAAPLPPPPRVAPPLPPPPVYSAAHAADDTVDVGPLQEASPEVVPAFVETPSSIVEYDGKTLEVHVSTIPDAKQAIKELR